MAVSGDVLGMTTDAPGSVTGDPAQASAGSAPGAAGSVLDSTLSVVCVYYAAGKGLSARVGLIPRSPGSDWRDRVVAIYRSLADYDSLRVVGIETDTMPLTTVDRLVALSGFRPPDLLVLDARKYGVPVLYGAMRTLAEHKPVLLFSADPPGVRRDYDTTEHYTRFIDLMSRANYWLASHPNRYDYVMWPAEAANA